ncbi:hypothetical protein [Clostridium sp. 1001271B_151109_B4]|uniref:hypothetical protein n=1 Tax=Clostridium sp. 1001271B_151109_B4 TaxID=2787148 RepID=UPI0018A9141B|nr:hypothetical protein [Clostridium sp. 1001271B_151109_B4]
MFKLIKKYFIPLVAIILLIIGFVKINMVNTESLSPLGTTDDNFKVVSTEFGEDFQEFIMDKSPVKIYIGEKNDGLATVKVYDKSINLTNNNFFMKSIKKLESYISKTYSNLKDKIIEITKTKKEDTKSEENNSNNSEFDKSVDEFIKNNSN